MSAAPPPDTAKNASNDSHTTPRVNATEIIANVPLTDQYGKPFDAKKTLAGKPYFVFFGHNGCARCQKMVNTMKHVQDMLHSTNQNIPILLVTVDPENDKAHMKDYLVEYYHAGLRQYFNDPDLQQTMPRSGSSPPTDAEKQETKAEQDKLRKRLDKTIADNEPRDVRDRALHMLCAEDSESSNRIHQPLTGMRHYVPIEGVPPVVHSFTLTLCDSNGQRVKSWPNLDYLPQMGATEEELKLASKLPILTNDVRDTLAKLHNPSAARLPDPAQPAAMHASTPGTPPAPDGVTNASLWNFGVPAVVAVTAAIAMKGAMTLRGLLMGLLAVTGASVMTQWVTGKGIFTPSLTPAPEGNAPQPQNPAVPAPLHTSLHSPQTDYSAILEREKILPTPITGSTAYVPPKTDKKRDTRSIGS